MIIFLLPGCNSSQDNKSTEVKEVEQSDLKMFISEEKELFEKVKAENKIQSYKDFLIRFPKGKFSKDVQNLLEKRYAEGIKTCSDLIIEASDYCFKVCSGYSTIWKIAIESRYLDFNKQILTFQEELRSKGRLDEIMKTRSALEEFMKKFIDPLTKHNEAYKKLVELYGIYCQVYALSLQPVGSLMSFNNSVNQLQSEIVRTKSELDAMIDIRVKEDSN
jgi:hypothetical protein